MRDLAPFVRILGRGPGRARNLTRAEAADAMAIILAGDAAPEAVGALLMLMRYRGETAEEIAGFTAALRATLPRWTGPPPAVDWPSYAAGRSRGLPLFLLAARLVAQAGAPVLLHGWNSHQGAGADVRSALAAAGIARATNLADAAETLALDGIVYAPLEMISPRLLDLLRLRDVLGLRSCLNTVARMANPAGAALSVQGVFHPPYRALQSDAAALLNQPMSATIKGGGGEFERHPGKPVDVVGQTAGDGWTRLVQPLLSGATRLAEGPDLPTAPDSLTALWSGRATDHFAEVCITGTAALALRALGRASTDAEAQGQAERLWTTRLTHETPSVRIEA